jgi:Ca2+-dependent lipid-binding protein
MASLGILVLTLVEGKFIKDVEAFGKMDPYITATYREQEWKSEIKEGAGKRPRWFETSMWDVKYAGDDMVFEARDDDVLGSEFIGKTHIKVGTFTAQLTFDDWIPVYDSKGKEIGKLHWTAEW